METIKQLLDLKPKMMAWGMPEEAFDLLIEETKKQLGITDELELVEAN